MSVWQSVIPVMVRHLIGDVSDTPVYSDSRIETAVVVAGTIVSQEYTFDTEYTFDLVAPDITPDPVEEGDSLAIALFSLKAACILSINTYQTATGRAIRVQDGDTSVSTGEGLRGYSDILKNGPCASYQQLLKTSGWKQSSGGGIAVLSPFGWGSPDSGCSWITQDWGRCCREFYSNFGL